MLVVVEDGDAHALLEFGLDFEAGGGGDVFEVDAAEGRLELFDRFDQLLGVGAALVVEDLAEAERHGVDVGEALEEHRFAFHDGQPGFGADVAEPEDGGAVAHHRDEIPAGGVFPDVLGMILDLEAGLGDAGGVGERKLETGAAGLGRLDGDLAGFALAVVIEREFFEFFLGHFSSPHCKVGYLVSERFYHAVMRTGMPRPRRNSLASRMVNLPKWKIPAASTASAHPVSITSAR